MAEQHEHDERRAGDPRAVAQAESARSDAQLLNSFATSRDDGAFATLVARHGPMVWKVCRRLLPGVHDAEDAFQATFLVLAKSAARLRQPHLLGNWLYGVAYRVALRMRGASARRRSREMHDPALDQVAAPAEPATDVQWLVHDEVHRLPEKYRAPVVLCCLEGRTNEEAAETLRCPVGTVKGRLSRARDLLRNRLARRQVSFSFQWLLDVGADSSVPSPEIVQALIEAARRLDKEAAASSVPRAAALAAAVTSRGWGRTALVTTGVGLALAALAALLWFYVLRPHDPVKADLARLQGTWQAKSMTFGNKEFAIAEGGGNGRWVIETGESNRLVFLGQGMPVVFTFDIDPTKQPKAMDLAPRGRPQAAWHWIYEIEGDRLRMAGPYGPGERPQDFVSPPGGQVTVFVFERVPQDAAGDK